MSSVFMGAETRQDIALFPGGESLEIVDLGKNGKPVFYLMGEADEFIDGPFCHLSLHFQGLVVLDYPYAP